MYVMYPNNTIFNVYIKCIISVLLFTKCVQIISLMIFLEIKLLEVWTTRSWMCISPKRNKININRFFYAIAASQTQFFFSSRYIILPCGLMYRTQASLAWASSVFVCTMKERPLCCLVSVCVCVIVSMLGCRASDPIWVKTWLWEM